MVAFSSRGSLSHSARLLVFASLALCPAVALQAQSNASATSPAPPTSPTSSDQYSGVSHPPSDDAIVANDDVVATAGKPMPGTPLSAGPQSAAPQFAAPQPAPRPAPTYAAQPAENPDYGIVTGVAPEEPASATAEERSAHLVSRPTNPDYGIIGMVPSPANQLAEGTNIHVRLLQALSTRQSQDGEPFRSQVAADVYKDGRVVIPMGSELRGRITQVSQGHRLGNHATLRLRPDSVILPDGTAYHLLAQAISTSQPNTHTDQEGGIQPTAHIAKNLAEYGSGAGGGAIVGAVFGGPVGAGAGALVGAGVVTTHLLLQKPQQAHVEEGSEIVFSLTEPMDLLPTRN